MYLNLQQPDPSHILKQLYIREYFLFESNSDMTIEL
jgi:hypothetical protein